jgi:hypothetical protein
VRRTDMNTQARQIRKDARISLIVAAVHSGKAVATVRLYEADPWAVSETVREDLDAYYLSIATAAKSPRTRV